jgi:hypothetical protein
VWEREKAKTTKKAWPAPEVVNNLLSTMEDIAASLRIAVRMSRLSGRTPLTYHRLAGPPSKRRRRWSYTPMMKLRTNRTIR